MEDVERMGALSRTVGIMAILIGVGSYLLLSCACGHMERLSLIGSLPAFALAWVAFLMRKDSRPATRIVVALACLVTTIVLMKNLMDVLWLGHDALLGYR